MKSHRFRIAVAALALGLAVLSLASPASAFIRLTRAAASGTGVVQAHWLDSELPLLSVVDATNDDLPYATALGVVQTSAMTWQNVNTSYFTVNAVDWTSGEYIQPALANDGQNSVLFDREGANFPPGGLVIAFVRSFIDLSNGHTLDADLVFNDKEFYQSITDPVSPDPPGQISVDVEAVITHEYGHYFSLDHTSIANCTMIPFILDNTSQRTLELDDRAGLSTVYAESASRPGGVTPGGVDFGATTGTISGTCVSGHTGAATFGAHVEAINLADPTPEASISAISGELTLRNGQGDWKIYGLPPGNYAVRIVPLDGVQTIAADPNIGGVFNGIDINFEPEFWNAAGEGGCGFTDLAGSYASVSVSAAANSGGINFVTNAFPGQVDIAQYGTTEFLTFRNTGYLAVRFDPPFDPPYTVKRISFPSFTFDGNPAAFVGVGLCEMLPNGLPNIAAPLFFIAPFNGSPNGVNDIPINLTVNDAGKTYFWVWRFPAFTPPLGGPSFPFVRMDFQLMERGFFGNTYSISLAGAASLVADRNVAVTMTCQIGATDCSLTSTSGTPIQGAQSLGANRRATKTEFNFVRPGDVRADGFPMPGNSLDRTDLLARAPFGPWTLVASGGAGSGSISVESPPAGVVLWGVQAVDKSGHKAILTNTTITGFNEDADEPNGRLNEATPLTAPVVDHAATYSPAGDQDYYSFMAATGDKIEANAVATGQDGFNNMDLTMLLLDNSGAIVAFDDDSGGNQNPKLSYTVPPASSHAQSNPPRKFTILMTDFQGSLFSPTSAPRVVTPQTYKFSVSVAPAPALAGRLARGMDPSGFGFALGGPNPANPHAKLLYVLPQSANGARVSLRVYDIQGRLVRTLLDRNEQAGAHTLIWDGKDQSGRSVSSGTYFARITAGSFRAEEKVLFVK